jgi:hypothetical protein
MKKNTRKLSDDDLRYRFERERLEMSRPKQKDFRAFNTVIVLFLLVALVVAISLNRNRLGQLWGRITGRAAEPVETPPEKDDGPLIPGKDFL